MEDRALIADIRAFNRFYTRQIGVLDEHIAKSRFSLAEARVIYELANRASATAAGLARELALDPAYLSRILGKLRQHDLIVLKANAADRRQQNIALTQKGHSAFSELDRASDAAVTALLAPLAQDRRKALGNAMSGIRAVLGDKSGDAATLIRPPRIGELGWLIHRQGLLYNQQFGWNGEFEALIARIYHEFAVAPETPPKALWIAERQGAVAGSVFILPSTAHEGYGQLRMLYVEPEVRGQGLGRLLVEQCVSFARDSGYRGVRLWTQSVLQSARKIYAAAGFELVESGAHHSFGHDLTGEHWELAF